MKHGKKYIDAAKLIENNKTYDPTEALELCCKHVRRQVGFQKHQQRMKCPERIPCGIIRETFAFADLSVVRAPVSAVFRNAARQQECVVKRRIEDLLLLFGGSRQFDAGEGLVPFCSRCAGDFIHPGSGDFAFEVGTGVLFADKRCPDPCPYGFSGGGLEPDIGSAFGGTCQPFISGKQ